MSKDEMMTLRIPKTEIRPPKRVIMTLDADDIREPIGYLELEEAMTRLPVFKRIGWFRRMMLRWAFGLKYIKEG